MFRLSCMPVRCTDVAVMLGATSSAEISHNTHWDGGFASRLKWRRPSNGPVRPHQGVLGTIVVSQVAMATTAQMAEALTLASTTHGETSGCSECQEVARASRRRDRLINLSLTPRRKTKPSR